jgi:UDP-N-acetylglucosamine--N-acetylmuramyl-(pentapeptide) pyrophosphoryl-undecaprenol N-acetylglucosamine transferase
MVAGGTGGHIFPGLALAEELKDRGVEVVWVGRGNSPEETIAKSAGFEFERISAGQITGKSGFARLQGMAMITAGVFQALRVIESTAPDAVIGAGGFVSVPVLTASLMKGLKFFMLEQNCVPGRVTRFFARWAAEIFLTFPIEGILRGRWTVTGTPLRRGIIERCARIDFTQPPAGGRTLLVLGGSQGARVLNMAALDLAATLPNLRVIIVTGRRDYQLVRSLLRSKNCEIVDWTDHPEELYAQATLAVTRAGALVLSELLAFGVPMIVVPFPYAADRHQDANARYVAKAGAAVVLEQPQLSGLPSLVQRLMAEPEKLELMRQRAKTAARVDAGMLIAGRIMAAVSGEKEGARCLAD